MLNEFKLFTEKHRQGCLMLAVFLFSFAIFVLRRPDIILNPNLWAEDGVFWLQDAYNNGFIKSLLVPKNGYFQTISRLVFGITSLLPLAWAPLIANSIGLCFRAGLVAYIFSERVDFINLRLKMIFAAYIILMPGLAEVHANITNTHWYMALYMVLIVLSKPALTKAQKIHDYSIGTIAALSGPFVVLITPIILFRFLSNYKKLSLAKVSSFLLKNKLLAVILALSLAQITTVLITSKSSRSAAPLGFSFNLLSEIITNRIFLGSVMEAKYVLKLTDNKYLGYFFCLAGLSTLAFTFIKSNWKVKSIIMFACGVLALSLLRPMITTYGDQWPLLPYTAGDRYFVLPNIIFFYCAAFTLIKVAKWKYLSPAVIPILSMCLFFLLRQFKIPPLLDTGYQASIEEFNSLSKGQSMPIPINPEGFSMELIKK